MELNQVITTRRSVRKFAPTPVEREKITACLEASRLTAEVFNI